MLPQADFQHLTFAASWCLSPETRRIWDLRLVSTAQVTHKLHTLVTHTHDVFCM